MHPTTLLGRLLFVAATVATATLLSAGAASAAPSITSGRFTNPVAYDIRSLQSTHFVGSVNTAGVYAVLKVHTMRGDVVLYHGAISAANKVITLATWNGMGPDGRRLPSSGAYQWTMTISKGGYYATRSGIVSISRIWWRLSGEFPGPTWSLKVSRYMIPGNANVYVFAHAWSDPESGFLGVGLVSGKIRSVQPGGYVRKIPPNASNYAVDAGKDLNTVVHLAGATAIPDRGMHPVETMGTAGSGGVQYSFTVIQ